MNCVAALEAMLDAEPLELAGHGTSSLATHLASCARCRTVAQRLDADTRLLAVSIQPSVSRGRLPRGATVWVQRSLVPVGLMAALLMAIVLRAPDATVKTTSSTVVIAAPVPVAPPHVVADAAPIPVERSRPTRVRAYPAPTPVAAVRINTPPRSFAIRSEGDGGAVIVHPPAGQRVAVMRTSNPKLTVVWLY